MRNQCQMTARILARFVLIATIVGLVAEIAPVAVSNAAATKPTTAALTAYEQGQAYERLFQDAYLVPGTCGIVLERARCNADLRRLREIRVGDSTDTRMEKWFESGDIGLRVENWNDMYVPETAWTDDPVFAWWYTAGIASVAASIPQGNGTDKYVGSIADVLAKHVSAAPDDSTKWIPRGETPFARLAVVQASLEEIFPVEPYPLPSFGQGPISDVQLGIYISTLQELADNPFALSRPESRAFAAVVLARLQELHVKFVDGLSSTPLLNAVRQAIPTDREAIDAVWRRPLSQALNMKWPEGPRKAYLIGVLIAQVAYNAAVLKDANSDTEFRGVIATLPAWAGASEKTRANIATLQNIPFAAKGGKWEDINAAATAAVLDIVAER